MGARATNPPLSEEDPIIAPPASTSRPSYIISNKGPSDTNCPIKIAFDTGVIYISKFSPTDCHEIKSVLRYIYIREEILYSEASKHDRYTLQKYNYKHTVLGDNYNETSACIELKTLHGIFLSLLRIFSIVPKKGSFNVL